MDVGVIPLRRHLQILLFLRFCALKNPTFKNDNSLFLTPKP